MKFRIQLQASNCSMLLTEEDYKFEDVDMKQLHKFASRYFDADSNVILEFDTKYDTARVVKVGEE